ncbi:PREDICTED: uncharacterized protein LOC105447911 isoform X1 [Wasmannia auropunctata]|uniref:uncharacterized protein LOC105447911 isoform X1 n=2 Tax=Wasmannia auropunctata TaxID=64793 RepID=UPI0005F0C19C|nr:PREDICTED: uncharacterized protein LOC105447911 isoform X1 [Wasmannia auropunctata]
MNLIKKTEWKVFARWFPKFKTRFCKRGRTVRQKSLVVQRVLPIVSAPNMPSENLTTDTNKIASGSSLCQMQTDKTTVNANQEVHDKTFLDALGTSGDAKNSNSIITSATQILKEGEHQWLNSEVADFSLSSFLGQLESPMKGSQRSQTGEQIMEDTRPSSDVVSHMQCLMGENSVDYMAKFANLASQMASDENKK